MAPFQFAMNDVYLRDTSRKVKQTLDMKRKKGKYAACPPYGYRKAERTTDQLVPDETPRRSYSGFSRWRPRDNPAAVLRSSLTRTVYVRR